MSSYTKPKRIYLDHAAATPLGVLAVFGMMEICRELYGNPSSLHQEGVLAKKALERARRNIAGAVSAEPDEIVFTSGGTESNNLAIFGAVSEKQNAHIIVSAIEHPSVLECVASLGCEVTIIPVNENGIVSTKDVKEAIKENTVLVSIMYANNEIGTIQPIQEIAKIIRHSESKPLFHTDACQATNYLDMNVLRLGVDLMTFNASKIYGPKGVGALFVKRGTKLSPQIFGGGQEKSLRSGTENVPGIIGFAEAVKETEEKKTWEITRLTQLRDFFIGEVLSKIPDTLLNGDAEKRLPNNANISFLGADGEQIVIELDAHDIAASTGSACSNISKEGKVSPVISALGADTSRAAGAVRFTLGRGTTKADLVFVVDELIKIIKKVRK